MAVRYGFRVFTVELARGISGRRRLDPATCLSEQDREDIKAQTSDRAAEDYLGLFVGALEALKDSETALDDVPKLIKVVDGADEFVASNEPGTPRMRVTQVEVHGRRVSAEVEYGHLGYAHKALAKLRDGDAELDDKSPAQFYRAEFLIPDKGTAGILAAETIARSSALPALVAWVNHTLRQKFGDDDFPRLMTFPITDTDKLDKLLSGNTVAEIQLIKTAPDVDGVPQSGRITLTEKVRTTSKMTNAKTLIKQWVDRQRSQEKYTEEERIAQVENLATVVDPHAAQMEFTDGVVRLDEGNGKTVSVSPSKIGELFTYPISENRPGETIWLDRTRDQVLTMAAREAMSVQWG